MTELDSAQWKKLIHLNAVAYVEAERSLTFLAEAKDIADRHERALNEISSGIRNADAREIGKFERDTMLARALAHEATSSLDRLLDKLAVLRREMQDR